MWLPDPQIVDPDELIKALRKSAEMMILNDGDRDHMNTSNLTCGQTQGVFRLLLIAAGVIELTRVTDAPAA